MVKNPPALQTADTSSIPGSGRSPGRGNGHSLQYSRPENSMDRGAWWATVHEATKSWTRLRLLSTSAGWGRHRRSCPRPVCPAASWAPRTRQCNSPGSQLPWDRPGACGCKPSRPSGTNKADLSSLTLTSSRTKGKE